jgi:hypothetical protein
MRTSIAVYAALGVIAFVVPVRDAVSRELIVEPEAVPRGEVDAFDAELIDYAGSHLVYLSDHGVLSPTRSAEVWPHEANLIDLLAAGDSPDRFVAALVERRFDAVTTFDPRGAEYVALGGWIDGGYIHALNAVIRAGYAEGANGAPHPLLGRRPGVVDLSWARVCFDDDRPADCIAQGLARRDA